ncbi:MAG: hypothetical protein IRZ05_17665 [Micromonosporaceae bacterium]|nr:hypothetical protein [Micromonosporaceae bacterium]
MSIKIRMTVALVLALAAVACVAVVGPDYLHEIRDAVAAHQTTAPSAPPLLAVCSFLGLVAWLLVVFQQWRQRQIGWIVASFALSYLAVIAYAAITLVRSRTAVGHAQA